MYLLWPARRSGHRIDSVCPSSLTLTKKCTTESWFWTTRHQQLDEVSMRFAVRLWSHECQLGKQPSSCAESVPGVHQRVHAVCTCVRVSLWPSSTCRDRGYLEQVGFRCLPDVSTVEVIRTEAMTISESVWHHFDQKPVIQLWCWYPWKKACRLGVGHNPRMTTSIPTRSKLTTVHYVGSQSWTSNILVRAVIRIMLTLISISQCFNWMIHYPPHTYIHKTTIQYQTLNKDCQRQTREPVY